ncbi:hypothetical protein U0355_03465 [Salimicrobium sp. PL1-032A]|uniref:hypothetical protein n=1 Tax=Salimicrobium sp. PL1-032A TaxID=3095364 RepID=UPI0032612750
MKKLIVILLVIIIAGGGFYIAMTNNPSVEQFIEEQFIGPDGKITTFIQKEEYLTESNGLYMQYLLLTDNEQAFREQAELIEAKSEAGYLPWRDGEAHSNASVDDLRIMKSLYAGADKWDDDYEKVAQDIQSFIKEHQVKEGLIVDFYDEKSEAASGEVHLSYIDAEALDHFSSDVKEAHAALLESVEGEEFFPEVYDVGAEAFSYQDEVNMIDQSLIALNSSLLGIRPQEFLAFVEEEMEEEGRIYGRYERDTKEAAETYESPSAYAILILTYLENGEREVAEVLYERMKELQTEEGGYKSDSEDAHFFDNVLPAIAEEEFSE